MAQGVSRHKDDGQGDRHHFDNQRSFIAVQVLFVTIELSAVRLDVLLLEKGMWGRQPLAAGTPLSICFHCADNGERVAVEAMARAWGDDVGPVRVRG